MAPRRTVGGEGGGIVANLVAVLAVLAVCAALGVWCQAQVWKAGDPRHRQLRLRRPVSPLG